MAEAPWVPLRVAWQEALYGVGGFYRRYEPARHFRTSAHVSSAFAQAVAQLARRCGATSVCDLGAGRGEVLAQIHRAEPTWSLLGVEIRPRPEDLPTDIGWQQEQPSGLDGVIIANELLDNIPCDVVERDARGRTRLVEVDRATGDERLAAPVRPEQHRWLEQWWPLQTTGDRAEIGLARDTFWARVSRANPEALCVAVDYGHTSATRPVGGSLMSYRGGMQTPVSYDGRHDLTTHVAFDSLASLVGGTVRRQGDVLRELGLNADRPPLAWASEDPPRYLRALVGATEVAELTAMGSLGDHCWLLTPGARQP